MSQGSVSQSWQVRCAAVLLAGVGSGIVATIIAWQPIFSTRP